MVKFFSKIIKLKAGSKIGFRHRIKLLETIRGSKTTRISPIIKVILG